MQVKGSKVLVTGGASGMGRAFTLALARDGADVAFCDLSEDGIAETEAAAADLPGIVKGFIANVANEAQVVDLINQSWDALGGLDVLVNNAGIFRDGLLVKQDRETGEVRRFPLAKWQQVIDVDLTGPFLMTREFAAKIIESRGKGGVVVNISSVARHGNMGQSNYSAAKAGLVADTKLWAGELARYGIRTGAIAPGFIDTPILQGMPPEMLERLIKGVPLRRAGSPEEIYTAVKFIIECDYFTGRCIDVDGGLTL
ncbi:MAG: SDR family oxidoreductase [Alphaproteobacteria bacterium]|nr:SDR family oxidoreductase [Alphaproteobacteria bacterium]